MKKKFIKTPLKGVYVHGAKDVGTRTVNLLMGEHAGEYVRGDIMDANAVIQAFDELKGNVDSEHDSLEEVVDELHNLRDATDQSFEVFQEKAEEETANRIQGDKTLDEKIDQKERESKERDNTLQQNIDTEKQERVNADTQLRNDLTAEVNRAKARENALDSDIQAEATKRENDDNTIKDNLNAEVTRATAKENEIKAEVDVINGDSTTEGSFRKAIADVVGAAPEAYDTLKEIADKLNENDDLHAAINDAIATKADKVALNEEITRAKAAEAENKAEIAAEAARAKKVEGDNALAIQNEVSRATNAEEAINEAVSTEVERAKGQEAYLQNLVNTKADTTALEGAKTELDNKLAQKADTTTLNEQVDTLNAAISAKQDAGNYIPYENYENGTFIYKMRKPHKIQLGRMYQGYYYLNTAGGDGIHFEKYAYGDKDNEETVEYSAKGITSNKYNDCLATSDGTFKPISDFVLKTELPTVPTKTSELTNDSNFITADDIDFTPYATIEALTAETTARTEALTALEERVTANTTAITNINKSSGIPYDTSITDKYQTDKPLYIDCGSGHTAYINPYSGVKVANSDTSYVNITPSVMKLSDGNASCEINEYLGGIQCLSGTSDDSNGFKLSYNGLRIGKKSDINTNNNELISISKTNGQGRISTFKVDDNNIENDECKLNYYGLTNYKSSYTNSADSDVLFLRHAALHGAILVKYNSDLLIGNDQNIKEHPYWRFGFYGADFNGSDYNNRIHINTGNAEYANIYGIKLSNNVYNQNSYINDPCDIQNNKDYVSFSKKIKVSDIITDSTTDSSLNSVLSKKVDVNTYNSFTSYVSGQFNSFNGALSTFGGQIASKQDKITPTTELDLTSIDTADIESLRSIVKALATELNTLGLIKLKSAEETV